MDVQLTLLTFVLSRLMSNVFSQVALNLQVNPATNIQENTDVLLSCQISGPFIDSTYSVTIFRQVGSDFESLANKAGVFEDIPENVEFVDWGSQVLSLRINDVTRLDTGNYSCQVTRLQIDGTYMFLIRQTVEINVLYPASGIPECESFQDDAPLYDGDEIILECTFDPGNPPATLTWLNTGTIPVTNARIQTSPGSITSVLSLVLNTEFNDVVFTCSSNQGSCNLGPFTVSENIASSMTMKTQTLVLTLIPSVSTAVVTTNPGMSRELQSGVIAAIVIVALIIFIVIIIIYFILVRSGRCKFLINKSSTKSPINNISLEATLVNGKAAVEDSSHDNPVPVQHVISPIGGEVYAVVQKKKSEGKVTSNSSDATLVRYPTPPSYPRPPKTTSNSEGEQYANNTAIVSGTPAEPSSNLTTESNNVVQNPIIVEEPGSTASQLGTRTAEDQSEMNLYANTSEATAAVSKLPSATETKISEDLKESEMDLYAINSIAGISRQSAPSDLMNTNDHTQAAAYANTSNTMAGSHLSGSTELLNTNDQTEAAVYANTSDAVAGISHLPAPTEAAPPPPDESSKTPMSHTPGLEYADLDLSRPSAHDGIKPNRESVIYASVT